jgi:hypothetical protein
VTSTGLPPAPDTPTARRLAVEARVDPRTITRVALGGRVRGDAGHRAREVLVRHGWSVPSVSDIPEVPK